MRQYPLAPGLSLTMYMHLGIVRTYYKIQSFALTLANDKAKVLDSSTHRRGGTQ